MLERIRRWTLDLGYVESVPGQAGPRRMLVGPGGRKIAVYDLATEDPNVALLEIWPPY